MLALIVKIYFFYYLIIGKTQVKLFNLNFPHFPVTGSVDFNREKFWKVENSKCPVLNECVYWILLTFIINIIVLKVCDHEMDLNNSWTVFFEELESGLVINYPDRDVNE